MSDPKNDRARKRSRAAPAALMGAAAFALSACQDDSVDTAVFPNVDACLASAAQENSWWTEEECRANFDAALAEHERAAPHYADAKLCAEEHAGNCTEVKGSESSGGGSFFMPLMMGYMMGNIMNGGSRPTPQPLYTTSKGSYATPSGAMSFKSNSGSARVRPAGFRAAATTRGVAPMTRATVTSRGGFGASRTSFGG